MDPRHSAYTRRLEKTSHREKTLGALAVFGVAIGMAGVLMPPLDIDWPGLGSAPSEVVAGSGAAPAVSAAAPVAAQQGAVRRIYPYSIIPGGVADKNELARIIHTDRTVAAHYADFDVANARAITVTAPRAVYVSYRKGEQVFWTRNKLMLATGETLLTDGKNEMRARCANRISDVPMFPVEAHGPSESELDSFVTEATVEGSSMAIAAGPIDGFGEAGGGSYQTTGFPNGAGLLPPAAQPRPTARGPGAPATPGSYRPGVSNGGMLRGPEAPRDGGTGTTPPGTTPVSTEPAMNAPTTNEPVTTEPTPGGEGGTGEPVTPTTPVTPTPTPGGEGGTGQPTTPVPTPPVSETDPTGPQQPPSNPELPPTNPELPGTPDNPGTPDTPIVIPDDPADVPEPGTLWLGGAALAAMAWMRRKGPGAMR